LIVSPFPIEFGTDSEQSQVINVILVVIVNLTLFRCDELPNCPKKIRKNDISVLNFFRVTITSISVLRISI